MVADGEGGGRAVKVDYSTFLRIFFDGVTFDGHLSLNDSISTHFSNFFVNFEKRDEPQTGSDDP